ncbi:MAG TPA: DUF6600 domain-containing protein [Verrucomicrobiae bacterium]|nr:DUF6600 domain-containing protein [Verrucomicrobiae bacterium]
MKTRSWTLLCAALALSSLATSESFAGVSFSVSIFNAPLQSCGYWISDPGYGRCWRPAYVASNWYPYSEGYWMWTSCGWYWVSSEPWAWATYHYGRWAYDPYYGWIWVPDTVWGPSWVCWREGGGYCGWAPLPPGAVFGPTGEIVYRTGPPPDRFFVFVDIGHFSEPIHRRDVIVNNTVIINKTVNITGVTRVNNVVVNRGLKVDEIQKHSARKLTEAPPRAALERNAATTRPRGTIPEVVRPGPGEPIREPVKAEKPGKAEPEVIRGGSGQNVYERNQPEKQVRTQQQPSSNQKPAWTGQNDSTQPQPNKSQQHYYQNFESKGSSPYSSTAPDSVQPRHHASAEESSPRTERIHEKQGQGQPRSDQGRDESPKKGPPANN